MKKRSKAAVVYRDGREVKAPQAITPAQLQLMHDAYWPNPNMNAEDRLLRAARLVKSHDDSRRATGTALSIKARQTKIADRNDLIRVLRREGKRTDQIRKDANVKRLNGGTMPSTSTINRISPPKKIN
jgi:hypothetical protein